MKIVIDKCKECDCGSKRPIVNKKYYLCQEKNYERLNGGSYADKRIAQKKDLLLSARTPLNKITKRPKQVSQKQFLRNKQIQDMYSQMAETREHICSGCGTTQRLSHSHIIPRSRRKDLETDLNNLVYDCLSMGETKGCHDIWEHGSLEEKIKLNNFQARMDYILSVDTEYYSLIATKRKDG